MNISSASSASFLAGHYSTQSFDRRMATGSSSSESSHQTKDIVDGYHSGGASKGGDSTEKEGSETYVPLLYAEEEDSTVNVDA